MAEPSTPIAMSRFANVDARIRCVTPDCWGDLLLMPSGAQDEEGFPAFHPFTTCPLCLETFELDRDMSDRDLFLRISWLRANPDALPDNPGETPPG